jgi:predicted small secreted protein
MYKKLMAILMLACFAGLAGCNTMSGLARTCKKAVRSWKIPPKSTSSKIHAGRWDGCEQYARAC